MRDGTEGDGTEAIQKHSFKILPPGEDIGGNPGRTISIADYLDLYRNKITAYDLVDLLGGRGQIIHPDCTPNDLGQAYIIMYETESGALKKMKDFYTLLKNRFGVDLKYTLLK